MSEDVLEYYNAFPAKEEGRLDKMWMEFFINSTLILKHLEPNSKILDIGAGPGKYAAAMALADHKVFVADPAFVMVESAKKHCEATAKMANILGYATMDVRDLTAFGDGEFDAVIALGPFYHLQETNDRMKAISEIARVLKPNGLAFLAFIPRTYMIACALADPTYLESLATPGALSKFWIDGKYEGTEKGRFTGAFCAKIDEICKEFRAGGLLKQKLYSSESIAALMDNAAMAALRSKSESELDLIQKLALEVAEDTSLLGLSIHIMCIARKEPSII